MIRNFFLICIALVLGAFLYQQIAAGSGYILISIGNTRIEMSFWMGVFLLLAGIGVSLGVWKLSKALLRWITTGTVNVASLKIFRSSEKTIQRRTARGLVEFMEGNWKSARKHLLASARRAETPMINYLAAARSTYELGNDDEALELLHKAETSSADSGLAVALTQARMLMAKKKYEQCLANLERAKKIAPQHPVVLDLLQKTYVQLQDWKSLKALIPDLRKHNVMSAKEFVQLEQTLYSDLLQQAGEKARRKHHPDDAAAVLTGEWNSFPVEVRHQEVLLEQFVKLLLQTQNEKTAEQVLRKEIKRSWQERLVILYGRISGSDVKKQLLVAEGWLKERPGSAPLMLTLGRLCLRNHRWTEARQYFESSLKLKSYPETYAELARLLAHLGDYKLSTDYYQRGLLMTTDALPQLPLPPLEELQENNNLSNTSDVSSIKSKIFGKSTVQ